MSKVFVSSRSTEISGGMGLLLCWIVVVVVLLEAKQNEELCKRNNTHNIKWYSPTLYACKLYEQAANIVARGNFRNKTAIPVEKNLRGKTPETEH